jgi:hypothetical protein
MQDDTYYAKLIEDFKKSKEAVDSLTKRQDVLKKELVEALKEKGIVDDKGHLWWSIAGSDLKYERRVSRSLNTSAAEAWAREKGLWDDVKEVVEALSEDKLLGYAWNHKESEEVIQSFYVEKESWAFKA